MLALFMKGTTIMKKTILTFVLGIAVVFSAVNYVKTNYAVEDFTEEIISDVADGTVICNKVIKVSSATEDKKNPVCIICKDGKAVAPETLKQYDRDVIVCHISSKNNDAFDNLLIGLAETFKPAPAYASEVKK